MKKTLLALALVGLTLTACTDPKAANKALDAAGFTNVQLGGSPWFACSKDDDYSTSFTATNPLGKRVTGTVCSGWFKGATIRFD